MSNALSAYGVSVLVQVAPIFFLIISWEVAKFVFLEPTFVVILGLKVCFAFVSVIRVLQVLEALDDQLLSLIARFLGGNVFIYSFFIVSFAIVVLQISTDQTIREVVFVLASFVGVVCLAGFVERFYTQSLR